MNQRKRNIQRQRLMRLSMLIIIAMLCLPTMATAHNLWLNATDFNPTLSKRTGAHTKMYFGFGHRFPVHDFLSAEKLTEFTLIRPNNSRMDLEAGTGGYLATPLVLKKAGGYTVAAATKHGFYTMYNKGDRVLHATSSMEGIEDVILSLYFENYTKALINVGQTADNAYASAVGHNIEIVALENPYLKQVGDTLDVQVLFEGKPLPFCTVAATYVGFSSKEAYAFSSKTNIKGVAKLRLLHHGQWILMAVLRQPATENLKEQCLEMKYSASLSFEVK